MPTVIVESHIPFVGDSFAGIADVRVLPPEKINAAAVRDADILIVRTRTRCDAALLSGSKVRMVATATIGTDHIDKEYCRHNGIEVVSAPGCNAPAVAQYVWASVLTLLPVERLPRLTVGVVGLGHVGSIVADWAHRLGARVLACDPPRRRTDGGWDAAAPFSPGGEPFVSLDEIARKADVITFHTPHTRTGVDATHHLGGEAFFAALERKPVVINAARGPVFDTAALVKASREGRVSGCVIDCWEGEPALDPELLMLADIATPHIAGYSVEGKRRATAAVVAAARRFLGASAESGTLIPHDPCAEVTPASVLASYNPLADTAMLKNGFSPELFERLRNGYPLRHELGFSDTTVCGAQPRGAGVTSRPD